MEEIVNILVNNGIGVACIVYFMYFNSTTLKAMTETMNEVKQSLILFNERLENIEKKLDKKGD
ncbi:MAG: hypothetical protein IIZ67_04905 [Bacilli bacterium]|nr:hypothetical protein [Bacilli bacterium]